MEPTRLTYQVRAEWDGHVWKLRVPQVLPGTLAESPDPACAGEIAAAAVAGALDVPRSSFSLFLTMDPEQVRAWAATEPATAHSATIRRGMNVPIARSLAIEAAIVDGSTP